MSGHLKERAKNIRKNILQAGSQSASAHFGGSLSCVDILAYLYGQKMSYDCKNPDKPERDRFILSKGHCALALYATLCEFGFISEEELMSFNKNGGDFPSHCVQNRKKGIELSSGSLGMGLSFGIGQALALQEKGIKNIVYVLVGNGEANEGSVWESLMFAGHKKIDNICFVFDDNKAQNDGDSRAVMPVYDWAKKLEAFGCKSVEVDGHNFQELEKAFYTEHHNMPLAVVAHTIKGKGVSFMEENAATWHHSGLTQEQYTDALAEIEKG